MERLPGFRRWGLSLEDLVGLDRPLWVYGEAGCGVSTVAAWLAERRSTEVLDDADLVEETRRQAWLQQHPRGILASHRAPEEPAVAAIASRCVALRLHSLEEDPGSLSGCLAALAQEEGLGGALPPPLGRLPCPGNLRGLRNRLVRWRLLGQLPDEMPTGGGGPLPLESEDMATNLHVLERLLLHRALRRSYGNRVEAARRLGVSRRQLYLLIARHGDPVRGEVPTHEGPKRLEKRRGRQNSSPDPAHR